MKSIKSGNININFFKDESGKCHIEATENGNFVMSFANDDRDICNYLFICMKTIAKKRELTRDDLEDISLGISLYFGDFDGYSDGFKDVNNVRPHMSQEEFDALCVETRVRVREALDDWKG